MATWLLIAYIGYKDGAISVIVTEQQCRAALVMLVDLKSGWNGKPSNIACISPDGTVIRGNEATTK